ncbi:penicillin acylase family protein [Oleiharenicola lentus]|nr:penicillin acylase family protein [Oleiharenicola lentus]
MGDALWKRLQLLVSLLSVLLVLALLAAGAVWWRIRASLPPLDGTLPLPGLAAEVKIERDALGVPTITGANRLDVARASGYLHAQDRFFQMDLTRRSGAGELAELFGPAALAFDQGRRLHGFRPLAGRVLAQLPTAHRALLEAYTAGVNAGLAALPRTPWEYTVLRTDPRPWQPEDCLLVVYAMWLDLQDTTGDDERSRLALRETLGSEAAHFFAPPGTAWDSALDGSTLDPAPLPRLQLRPPEENSAAPVPLAPPAPKPGSNSFALAGEHTSSGVPLVANDMHLDHRLPHAWYRAVLKWPGPDGTVHRLVGVTLPGVPILVAGSNGRVAWGFTNAYTDTADVIVVETDPIAQVFYRTAAGQKEITGRNETITVKGAAPVDFKVRLTEWGPVFGRDADGNLLVLRWTAHDAGSLNLEFAAMETAAGTAEALAIARRTCLPNQNLIVADTAGGMAWTILGRHPRRIGYDGRYPVSWGYGDRRWDGWLAPEETPVVRDPADGLLWTANQRLVGGEAYEKLGDGGYDNGARGAQIRDGLRALVASGKKAGPADLLALQLDDRALFLERWQQLLLGVLDDAAIQERGSRADLRDAVRAWNGRASTDSAAFRLVHAWRWRVAEHVFAPYHAQARTEDPGFNPEHFQLEHALWQLVSERPPHLLNPAYSSWPALLLQAADEVLAESDRAGLSPDKWTWGAHNRLKMRHPFSRLLPAWIGRFLDMPADPLPGATEMPRVQTPEHGASERLVVSPGREEEGLFHMPGGQSGNPASPFYRAGHEAWVKGDPTPLLPGPTKHTLVLQP